VNEKKKEFEALLGLVDVLIDKFLLLVGFCLQRWGEER